MLEGDRIHLEVAPEVSNVDFTLGTQVEGSSVPGFSITGTIYAYGEIRPGRVDEVQRRLSEAAGVPVRLRVTIVPAILTKAGGTSEDEGSEAMSPVVPSIEVEGLGEPSEGSLWR